MPELPVRFDAGDSDCRFRDRSAVALDYAPIHHSHRIVISYDDESVSRDRIGPPERLLAVICDGESP